MAKGATQADSGRGAADPTARAAMKRKADDDSADDMIYEMENTSKNRELNESKAKPKKSSGKGLVRKTEILDNRTRGRKSTGTNDGSEDEDETTKPVKKSQEKPATKTKTSGKSPSEDKMEKSVKKPAGDEKEKAIKEKAAPKPSKMPKLDDDRMEPAKKDDPKSSSSSSAKSTKTTKSVKSSKPKDYNDEEPPMKRADPLLTSPKPPKPTSSHPPSSSAFKSPHRSASSETPRSKISSSLPAKAKPASDLPLNASAERVRQEYETLKLQYTTLQRHYDELRHVGITKANESFDKYKTETMKQTAVLEKRITLLTQEVDSVKDQLKKRTAEFDELEANSEKAKNSAEAEIAQLREETEQLKNDLVQALATPAVIPASDDDNKLLKLYVELTGLIVSPTPEEPVSWDCALQCPIGELRFQLALAPSGKEYIYRPRSLRKDNGEEQEQEQELPPFMDDEIRFARAQLGNWYRKVVGWAFQR